MIDVTVILLLLLAASLVYSLLSQFSVDSCCLQDPISVQSMLKKTIEGGEINLKCLLVLSDLKVNMGV